MKTSHTLFTLPFLFATVAGCGGDANPPSTMNSMIVHVPFFIEDAAGQPPADPSTRLFESRAGNAVLAPDGHQVTLGEFDAPTGSAAVSCADTGTHAVLDLQGLIPGGKYSVFNLVFKDPGFDPTFANLIGYGAVGSADGAENTFVATATGAGHLAATTPAGPLSAMGQIGACALHDEFEWHLVGAYHIDGQSHGPVPGPDGTAVEQLGFMFKR